MPNACITDNDTARRQIAAHLGQRQIINRCQSFGDPAKFARKLPAPVTSHRQRRVASRSPILPMPVARRTRHHPKNRSPNLEEYDESAGGFARWFGAKPAAKGPAPRFLLIHDQTDDRAIIQNSTNSAAI